MQGKKPGRFVSTERNSRRNGRVGQWIKALSQREMKGISERIEKSSREKHLNSTEVEKSKKKKERKKRAVIGSCKRKPHIGLGRVPHLATLSSTLAS
jgi:hypothetical protein